MSNRKNNIETKSWSNSISFFFLAKYTTPTPQGYRENLTWPDFLLLFRELVLLSTGLEKGVPVAGGLDGFREALTTSANDRVVISSTGVALRSSSADEEGDDHGLTNGEEVWSAGDSKSTW